MTNSRKEKGRESQILHSPTFQLLLHFDEAHLETTFLECTHLRLRKKSSRQGETIRGEGNLHFLPVCLFRECDVACELEHRRIATKIGQLNAHNRLRPSAPMDAGSARGSRSSHHYYLYSVYQGIHHVSDDAKSSHRHSCQQ